MFLNIIMISFPTKKISIFYLVYNKFFYLLSCKTFKTILYFCAKKEIKILFKHSPNLLTTINIKFEVISHLVLCTVFLYTIFIVLFLDK